MARLLLVAANRERFPEPVYPVGAAYVAAAAARDGTSVRVLDAGMERFPSRALRREIEAFRPDAVGLSLRNADNAAYPHTRCSLPGYVALANAVREAGGRRLLLGGPAFSIFPEELLALLRADGGAVGDGEDAIGRLLRGEGGPVVRGVLDDLGRAGFPRDAAAAVPRPSRYRAVGVQTARGCPHRCVYCTYPVIEGIAVRTRPPEAVADEIAYLARGHGTRDVFIVDSSFNADEGHMARVCRAISSRRTGVRLSCYLAPKVSDPSLFGMLADAGCVAVDFGTDSGSDRMLGSLGKGFGADDVRRASAACRAAGIDFCHSLLFGGPGETEATVAETVRLMDEIAPTAVVAMTGVRVYPGTPMARTAVAEGLIAEGESLLGPRFYFAGGDPARLLRCVGAAAAARRNWFLPGERDWSAAPGPRLLRLVHRAGPLWRAFRGWRGRAPRASPPGPRRGSTGG